MTWAGIGNSGAEVASGNADLGVAEVLEDAASNGAGYLVSWSQNGDGRDSFVGRFDDAFNFLDPSGIPLAVGPGQQNPARLASDGQHYLAVWSDVGSLRAARIDAQGTILDPGGVVVAAPSGPPRIPTSGSCGTRRRIAGSRSNGAVRVCNYSPSGVRRPPRTCRRAAPLPDTAPAPRADQSPRSRSPRRVRRSAPARP